MAQGVASEAVLEAAGFDPHFADGTPVRDVLRTFFATQRRVLGMQNYTQSQVHWIEQCYAQVLSATGWSRARVAGALEYFAAHLDEMQDVLHTT